MTIQTGSVLTTRRGRTVRVGPLIGQGGQSLVFRGLDATGRAVAVKVFVDDSRREANLGRSRRLIELDPSRRCKAIVAPTDMAEGTDGTAAHVSRYVKGQPLAEHVYSFDDSDLARDLYVGGAVAHCCAVLHDLGVAHGDLHLGQAKILLSGDGGPPQVVLLDLDNYCEPGGIPSPMLGHPAYLAPRVRSDALAGRVSPPSIANDCFSLAVMVHEIVLRRHPAAQGAVDDSEFALSMSGRPGTWLDDPRNPDRRQLLGGRATRGLGAAIIRMFRSGLAADESRRPSAAAWREACFRSACSVGECLACGERSVADPYRRHCPYCRRAFGTLVLRGTDGMEIKLDRARSDLGRSNLGGGRTISELHCVARREPPMTWIEPFGKNGMFARSNGGAWERLPDGRRFPIRKGDRLRLASAEFEVEER